MDTTTGKIIDIIDTSQSIPNNFSINNNNLRRFRNKILLPGLCNVHSHAFQIGLRGKGEIYNDPHNRGNFWSWQQSMYKLALHCDENEFYDKCVSCFNEMRRVGITTVGEFHYFHHSLNRNNTSNNFDYKFDEIILKAAEKVGIRIVLLLTYYHSSGFDKPVNETQKRFYGKNVESFEKQFKHLQNIIINGNNSNNNQHLGITAHSIRAVNPRDLSQLYKLSLKYGCTFHMHIDETVKESQLCQKHYNNETPLELVVGTLKKESSNGRLSNVTAIHCTQSKVSALKEFVDLGGSICMCPLTEGCLSDGIANLFKVEDISNNLCVGSDCNARIDLFEELRWLEYIQRLETKNRGVLATKKNSNLSEILFNIGTKHGGKALGIKTGIIDKDYFADFICVDLNHPTLKFANVNDCTLLGSLIFGCNGESVVTDSCVSGKWVSFDKDKNKKNEAKTTLKTTAATTDESSISINTGTTNISGINDVVSLAEALININSVSGKEGLMADALESWLKPRGWAVLRQKLSNFDDRYNILAYPKGTDYKEAKLLFNSHIDTVPPFFKCRIDKKGNKISGRGACDTKSLIAAQLLAAEELKNKYGVLSIALLYVCGEETTHIGMIEANKLGLKPDYLIVGEPTQLRTVKRQKGILKCKLICKGKEAHSGYPETGINALTPLLNILYKIENVIKWPGNDNIGYTTVNIGKINSGVAANVVPNNAEALLLFRCVTKAKLIETMLKELIDKENKQLQLGEENKNKISKIEYVGMTMNDPVSLHGISNKFEPSIIPFNTDIPFFEHFNNGGCKVATIFGAGYMIYGHTDNEHIKIDQLKKCVHCYIDLGLMCINQEYDQSLSMSLMNGAIGNKKISKL